MKRRLRFSLACNLMLASSFLQQGFNLSVLGGIEFSVNGKIVGFFEKVGYRGMIFTDVSNMVWVMGCFRENWTLRVDLIGDFI